MFRPVSTPRPITLQLRTSSRPRPQMPQRQRAPTRTRGPQAPSGQGTPVRGRGWQHSASTQSVDTQRGSQTQGLPKRGRGWQQTAPQPVTKPLPPPPPLRRYPQTVGLGQQQHPLVKRAQQRVNNAERAYQQALKNLEELPAVLDHRGNQQTVDEAKRALESAKNGLQRLQEQSASLPLEEPSKPPQPETGSLPPPPPLKRRQQETEVTYLAPAGPPLPENVMVIEPDIDSYL